MKLSNSCRNCLRMLVREAAVITARINEFLDEDCQSELNMERHYHVRLGFRINADCYEDEEKLRLEAGLICETIKYEDDEMISEICEENEDNLPTEDDYLEVLPTELNLEPDDPKAISFEKDYMTKPESMYVVLNDESSETELCETQGTIDEDDDTTGSKATEHDVHLDMISEARRSFTCTKCDKCFKRHQDLKQHSLIHDGFKPFVCEVCGQSFRQKNTLRTHQALHYGKTIECPECDKKFARRSHLILHTRSHRGEKPFRCNYLNCTAAYPQRTLLVAHQQMHAGLRKYSCELCGSAFFNRHGLLGHVSAVHSKYSFECHQCKKNFTKPFNIRNHMLNVHDIRIGSVAHLKKPFKKTPPPTDEFEDNANEELL